MTILPGAICKSGAIGTELPTTPSQTRGRHRTRARRWEGPRPARAAGERAPPRHLLPDREPHEDAAGTQSERSRNTNARPQSPEREDPTASSTDPLGTHLWAGSTADPSPRGSQKPTPSASLLRNLLLPRPLFLLTCFSRLWSGGDWVPVPVDAAPCPLESSTAGPEEAKERGAKTPSQPYYSRRFIYVVYLELSASAFGNSNI